MMCTNLQILNAWLFFGFSQLIGNITISGNFRVQIYKSYMHEHFCFCSLTKFYISAYNYIISVVYQLTDLVYTSV